MENGFEREVLDRLTKIEVKLDSYDKIKDQVYENQRSILKTFEKAEQQQRDIDDLRERNKWLARTLVASVISAGVSIVIAFIKIGAGM